VSEPGEAGDESGAVAACGTKWSGGGDALFVLLTVIFISGKLVSLDKSVEGEILSLEFLIPLSCLTDEDGVRNGNVLGLPNDFVDDNSSLLLTGELISISRIDILNLNVISHFGVEVV